MKTRGVALVLALSIFALSQIALDANVITMFVSLVGAPLLAWYTTHALNTKEISRISREIEKMSKKVDELTVKVERVDERTEMMLKSSKAD